MIYALALPLSKGNDVASEFRSTERETRFCPGVQGGVEWNGQAYHPGLGLLYVNPIDWCTRVKMQPIASIKGTPGASWTGAEPADGWLFGRHDPVEQWKGWVTAFDPESGDVKWKIQTPKPMVAAITATAGRAGVHRRPRRSTPRLRRVHRQGIVAARQW